MKIYKLAEDTIDNKDYISMIDFLEKRKYLNQSIYTKRFQEKFSNFLDMKYSIFVSSGSSANLLIAQVLLEGNFLKNKIVVLPAVSWATTVSPFLQLGYKILLCDCDQNNLGLSIEHLEKICKKYNPGLVVVVNVLGHSNNFKKINTLKKKYNFKLIEDNCESLGSFKGKKKLGSYGLASSHSFYFGHHISTIEGGMICTNDEKIYETLLQLRSHGWDRDLSKETQKSLRDEWGVDDFTSLYTFYMPGFNLRSTDLQAFLGINQLSKVDKVIEKRNKNFKYFESILQDKIWFPKECENSFTANFAIPIITKNKLEKELLVKNLNENNIECRPLISGSMGIQPFYKKKYGELKLPNCTFVDECGIYVPNHDKLTENDIELICKILINK